MWKHILCENYIYKLDFSAANLERFRSLRRHEAEDEAKDEHKFQKTDFISMKEKVNIRVGFFPIALTVVTARYLFICTF